MAKLRSYLVALLLGSSLLSGFYFFLFPPSPQRPKIKMLPLPEVQSEEEFQAILGADRAALVFRGKWSTESMLSERVVKTWVGEGRPAFGVYLVDPDDQPYVRRWLEEQGRDNSFHPYQKRGTVTWLRRGQIVGELSTPWAGGGIGQFEAIT